MGGESALALLRLLETAKRRDHVLAHARRPAKPETPQGKGRPSALTGIDAEILDKIVANGNRALPGSYTVTK